MGCVIRVLQLPVYWCQVSQLFFLFIFFFFTTVVISFALKWKEVLWVMTIFMSFLVLRYYREVLPGEIVQISRHGIKTLSVVPRPEGDLPAFCIFEYVYFARPDSIFEGLNNEY